MPSTGLDSDWGPIQEGPDVHLTLGSILTAQETLQVFVLCFQMKYNKFGLEKDHLQLKFKACARERRDYK